MIRFLGGIRFTLVLIALSALFVAAGTFIESKTGSHETADELVYGSIPFKLLLSGFFINILLSTLLRWPFQKKHFPFILTHIGLLMVILGVFVKTTWGVQGTLQLMEGTASNTFKLSGKYALYREKRTGAMKKENVTGILQRGEEKFSSFIYENALHLLGRPPLPIPGKDRIVLNGISFDLFADTSPPPADLSLLGSPYIYFEDREEMILIHHGNGAGLSEMVPIKKGFPDTYAAYDKGIHGYTAVAMIPYYASQEQELIEELKNAEGTLSPPLQIIKEACKRQNLDFPSHAVEVIRHASTRIPHPLEEALDFSPIETAELNALRFARNMIPAALFPQEIPAHLTKISWPLEPTLEMVLATLYSHRFTLPYAETTERLFPLLLALYGIKYETLIQTLPPPEPRMVEIESPLLRTLSIGTGNTPCLTFDQGAIALNSPLKTAIKGELYSLSEIESQLPFEIRLHKAEEIHYPHTSQPSEYRCKISIGGLHSHLSMNRVHETEEGYRLYLSGMKTCDENGVRLVQLIINKDPAKWLLTYPGGFIASFGTLLLLFGSSKRR